MYIYKLSFRNCIRYRQIPSPGFLCTTAAMTCNNSLTTERVDAVIMLVLKNNSTIFMQIIRTQYTRFNSPQKAWAETSFLTLTQVYSGKGTAPSATFTFCWLSLGGSRYHIKMVSLHVSGEFHRIIKAVACVETCIGYSITSNQS
jgi:hypothetical protein